MRGRCWSTLTTVSALRKHMMPPTKSTLKLGNVPKTAGMISLHPPGRWRYVVAHSGGKTGDSFHAPPFSFEYYTHHQVQYMHPSAPVYITMYLAFRSTTTLMNNILLLQSDSLHGFTAGTVEPATRTQRIEDPGHGTYVDVDRCVPENGS